MSEPILIALVQLFAVIAASYHEKISDSARLILENYLKQHLSLKELEEYLLLYDELLSFHDLSDIKYKWGDVLTTEKIEQICVAVSKKMQQQDKALVLIKFIEFILEIKNSTNKNTEDVELGYYQILRKAFNLNPDDFEAISSFLLHPDETTTGARLIITGDEGVEKEYDNLIYRAYLDGKIDILFLSKVGLLVGKYYGNDDLYMNGHYIMKNQSFTISTGSILKSQKIKPIYYTDIVSKLLYKEKTENIEFAVDEIEYKFKNSKNGIQPFSFNAKSGELIAVIGASGAGKSTLLNLLNGNIEPQNGTIYINGQNLNDTDSQLKKVIGYIPQDDLLIEELTVFQNLYFNAKLCYKDYSKFKLIRLVFNILNSIDLMEIRNLVVGSPLKKIISGGQRKRLNIALELLREPYILFADEPTSGLSSLDSEMVMLLLKEQTLNGRMVMVNIHQPSTDIFKLFDKLLFLDKGGYPIYYGNPIDSITYFKWSSNHVNPTESECLSCGYINPEQLFQITEAKTINKHGNVSQQRIHSPEDWYKLFRQKLQPEIKPKVVKQDIPKSNFNIPSKFKQLKIFSLRNFLIKVTNRQYLLLNLLEAPVLAIILAYLARYENSNAYYFGNNDNFVAFLFMSIVVSLFLGMMVSAEEIIRDKKILHREAFLNLSKISYINSKVLFLIGLSALQAFLYIAIGNLVLEINDMLFRFWLVLFSVSCFANLVGLNISSALNSVVNIYVLIPFILVPQILLSGVIVTFDNINSSITSKKVVPVVGDLMASRWAYEAMAVTQFTNNKYSQHFYKFDKEISNYSYTMGYHIPALESIVDICHRNIVMQQKQEQTKNLLEILKKEIKILEQQSGYQNQDLISLINPIDLTEEVRVETNQYLDSVRSIFAVGQRFVYKQRDSIYNKLKSDIGKNEVTELKKRNYNTSLADWVLDRRNDDKYQLTQTELIRKKDPIYYEPQSKFGRAHFYAPVKKLGNATFSTFGFNISVIWLMTIILYFTLWHDSLRKILAVIEGLFRKT